MNRILLPILLLVSCTAFSNSNFWKCEVYDNTEQSWVADHLFQRIAINTAYENCKQRSKAPQTCHASKAGCTYFANGVDTTPLWRCMALDYMSHTWYSNLYPKRDDAVLAARAYCHQRSGSPDTCYVNLLTCKSIEKTSF